MIRLGVIGLEEKFVQALSIALKNRGDDIYALVADGHVHLMLVDTDLANEQEYLDRCLKGAVPMLAIAGDPEGLGDRHRHFAAVLPKPLQFSRVMAAINALVHEYYADDFSHSVQSDMEKPIAEIVDSAAVAARQINKGVRGVSHVERASRVVEIDEFLLGMVLDSLHPGRDEPVHLMQWRGGAWLAIDRERQTVSTSLRPKALRSLAVVRRKEQELKSSDLTYVEFAPLDDEVPARMNLEEFLWSMTHWTVRSDRLDILDIDRVYRLKYWPNLTRYSVSDQDLPLANYWITHPSSVTELVEQLNIAAEQVFPFASCCLVAGFLEATEPSSASSPAKTPEKSKDMRSVLSSLLGKLARKG